MPPGKDFHSALERGGRGGIALTWDQDTIPGLHQLVTGSVKFDLLLWLSLTQTAHSQFGPG